MSNSFDLKARRKARYYAVQALYQWQTAQNELADIEHQFLTQFEDKHVEIPYFQELLFNIPKHLDELDNFYAGYLTNRTVDEIDPIELAILRLAVYELAHRKDVPYKVCINEALELTKTFGSQEGFKFVNGILDKTARDLRTEETR
ncbi:MAG: transcription antitermination factor NusB [Gammaproteobacteria bacterium]